MVTCINQQPAAASVSLEARGCTRKMARGCTRKLDVLASGSHEVSESPAKKQRAWEPAVVVVSNTATEDTENREAVGDTVTELNSQAMSLYSQGDFDTAAIIFRKAISLCNTNVKISPSPELLAEPENEQTKKDENPAAAVGVPTPSSYIYQRMDFDEGFSIYFETMPLSADDHPQSVEAILLFNAGQARKKLHDMEGASRFYDQAIKTFSPNNAATDLAYIRTKHAIIIPLLHAIAQLAYRNGKLEDALSVYEVALRHCREIHGKEDISTGRTLNCLGVICYHLSSEKSDRAKMYFEEALEVQNRILGEGSLESATTLNNLGRVHVQREEFSVALAHYGKALEIRKSLSDNHIDYAATAFNAGQSLHQLGEFDLALSRYNDFLRVALKKFSRNHRDVAVCLSAIAQIHQEKKDYNKALSFYEESLVVGRAALGNSHSEVAMLLNRLGNFFFDRGNVAKALTAYEEGLQIEQRVLEDAHPNIIVTLTNIGEIHRQNNDLENAVRLYLDALRLQKKCYGPSSIEVASTLNVLGLLYDLKGKSTLALSCLQEALVMRRSVLGDNHLEVSATLTYLGSIFFKQGATCMALQLFSESLRIRIDIHGKNNQDVSFTLYNVGLCHFDVGSYKEAIECYNETLRIEQAVLGENHKDVVLTLIKLGEAYAANNEVEQALESLQAAQKIEQEQKSGTDPNTMARILNEIGSIHQGAGNTAHMMEAFVGAARALKDVGIIQYDLPDQLYGFGAACPSSASAA